MLFTFIVPFYPQFSIDFRLDLVFLLDDLVKGIRASDPWRFSSLIGNDGSGSPGENPALPSLPDLWSLFSFNLTKNRSELGVAEHLFSCKILSASIDFVGMATMGNGESKGGLEGIKPPTSPRSMDTPLSLHYIFRKKE